MGWMEGWIAILRHTVFQSSQDDGRVIMERFPPSAGLEPGSARSAGQRLTYWATVTPAFREGVFYWKKNALSLRDTIMLKQMIIMTFFPMCRFLQFWLVKNNGHWLFVSPERLGLTDPFSVPLQFCFSRVNNFCSLQQLPQYSLYSFF